MLTAVIISKKDDVYYYITECNMKGEIKEAELKEYIVSENLIKCPLYTGKDCGYVQYRSVRNDYTKGRFIQIKSPKCVPVEKVKPVWKYKIEAEEIEEKQDG